MSGPSSNGSSPRPSSIQTRPAPSTSTSSYLSYPVSQVVSGLYRRITEPYTPPPIPQAVPQISGTSTFDSGLIHAPRRTASPFSPPPLTGLTLRGPRTAAQILTRTLAEEIRLLLPARLQLATDWTLAYSMERDGVSLATLYSKCAAYQSSRHGFVLVVKDSAGGIFGAYLTDAPRPAAHYFGTGECFLWRATVLLTSSILASLPPPPSADTTALQRSTTITAPEDARSPAAARDLLSPWPPKSPYGMENGSARPDSGAVSPERIRFKAFPYSGVNEYMMFCESDYLSVGGGDGKYGLWLDSVLERGVSSSCLTFGNEPLSEEGEKFEVMGVEVWYLGS